MEKEPTTAESILGVLSLCVVLLFVIAVEIGIVVATVLF